MASTFRRVGTLAGALVCVFACGGSTIGDIDGGGKDGSAGDGASDGATGDAAADAGGGDGGNACVPPGTACPANGCPQGTVCLKREQGPGTVDLGCTPLHPSCNGIATCGCMSQCFCPAPSKCMAGSGVDALFCFSGAISKRAFKAEISYVDDAERADLARQALQIPLATYRYRHLGFIIDDQPATSPAVQQDRTHVDEYGYTSMLLATVQEQQRQIDALQKRLDTLEKAPR